MRLSGFHLPLDHLSASAFGKAVACPEAFRRRYLLHEPESFGVERFTGSVDHKTIELCLGEKMQGKERWDKEELDAVYDYVWSLQLEKEENPQFGADSPVKLVERGKKMVALYHEEVVPSIDPVAVEARFEERIKGVPVPVIGFLDVETTGEIIERKTAANKLTKPKPIWKLQGHLYGLVTTKPVHWHVSTRQVTPQLVIGGTDNPEFVLQRQNPDRTVAFVQQIVYQLNDFYQRYGKDNPWPTLGALHDWMCSRCSYKPDCIAWRD